MDVSARALFAVALFSLTFVAIVALVVVPGVQRGGWLEVAAVIGAIAAVAVLDRWFRRVARRR